MSAQPVENLELRAMEQRRQIHETAEELKGKIHEAREKLDVRRKLSEHRLAVALVLGAASLLASMLIARRYDQ